MAYQSFSELGGAVAVRAIRPVPVADPIAMADQLTALEWAVVTLARKDRLAALRPPSRVGALLRALMPRRPNPRLADPRLEALRRMAVLTWHHGYTVPSREVSAFLAAGYTPAQYETLADRIGATRSLASRVALA